MRARGRRAYNVTGFVFRQPLRLDEGNFTMLGASYSTVVAQTPETIFRLVSDPMRDSFWNPNAINMKSVFGGTATSRRAVRGQLSPLWPGEAEDHALRAAARRQHRRPGKTG